MQRVYFQLRGLWDGRDVQKAQSLKDLLSLIVPQLQCFNPLLPESNLQPKPMEYSDFFFLGEFWREFYPLGLVLNL